MSRRVSAWQQKIRSLTTSYTGTTHTAASGMHERDGAAIEYFGGEYWSICGWWDDGTQPWMPQVLTNQIWSSPDLVTWTLDLAHNNSPPTSGAGARMTPRHTPWHAQHGGYIVLGWGDTSADRDTWRSNDPGNANGWERVATTDQNRELPDDLMGYCLFRGSIWLFGGYRRGESVACKDIWRMRGDYTFEWMGEMPLARASMATVVHEDRVYLIGGSDDKGGSPTYFRDVLIFDGTGWAQVTNPGGYAWPAGNWMTGASYDDRIWVLTGNAPGDSDCTSYSDDGCQTFVRSTWHGWGGSHADGVVVTEAHGIVIVNGHGHAENVRSLKADSLNPDALLLEGGDYLLTETGDRLLLE